jgi:hypothetical protein
MAQIEIDLEDGSVNGAPPGEQDGPVKRKVGRPKLSEEEKAERRKEYERNRSRNRKRETRASTGGRTKADEEVASRTERVLRRIADRRTNAGDDELAGAIMEDGPIIAQGVADITAAVNPLRVPLLLLLGVIEPAIAFLRVGGILAGRIAGRRQVPVEATVLVPNGDGTFHVQDVNGMVIDLGPYDELGNPVGAGTNN